MRLFLLMSVTDLVNYEFLSVSFLLRTIHFHLEIVIDCAVRIDSVSFLDHYLSCLLLETILFQQHFLTTTTTVLH